VNLLVIAFAIDLRHPDPVASSWRDGGHSYRDPVGGDAARRADEVIEG
jgi:hypothetical protein